jgi:hypothetical protein
MIERAIARLLLGAIAVFRESVILVWLYEIH